MLSKDISNYKVNIDIKSNQIKDKIIEVQTSLSLSSENKELEKINTKIIYAAVIELTKNIDEKTELEKIILINVPSDIYPELREIFIFIFESSGFKDIKINEEVDFQNFIT